MVRQLIFVALLGAMAGCSSSTTSSSVPPASANEIVQSKLGTTLHLAGPTYAPTVLSRVNPLYPNTARDFGTHGLVRMNTLISPAGDVVDVQVIEGLPHGLSEAAADAVRQWKFAPTMRNGAAMPVLTEVVIAFNAR
jgi:TonB family protein